MPLPLIIPKPGEDLLGLTDRCTAIYECPKDGTKRKGPLVIYAGKDDQERNLVGDIYVNFRMIEEHPGVVDEYAIVARAKLRERGLLDEFDTICGVPEGGRTFGQALARAAGKRFVYAIKKPKPTELGKKQEYTWDLSQFEFEAGERVVVVEDVFNNFQNTDNTLGEIAATGVSIVCLVGAFNRSPMYDESYTPKAGPFAGRKLPVVSAIRHPYPEYRQDDPEVAEDIVNGNLERNVKDNWAKLRASMNG